MFKRAHFLTQMLLIQSGALMWSAHERRWLYFCGPSRSLLSRLVFSDAAAFQTAGAALCALGWGNMAAHRCAFSHGKLGREVVAVVMVLAVGVGGGGVVCPRRGQDLRFRRTHTFASKDRFCYLCPHLLPSSVSVTISVLCLQINFCVCKAEAPRVCFPLFVCCGKTREQLPPVGSRGILKLCVPSLPSSAKVALCKRGGGGRRRVIGWGGGSQPLWGIEAGLRAIGAGDGSLPWTLPPCHSGTCRFGKIAQHRTSRLAPVPSHLLPPSSSPPPAHSFSHHYTPPLTTLSFLFFFSSSLSALEANALAGLQASRCQIGGPYLCWQRLKQWLGKERGEDERRRAKSRKGKRESWREKGKKEAALGFASGRMRSSNIDLALFFPPYSMLCSPWHPHLCVRVCETWAGPRDQNRHHQLHLPRLFFKALIFF